MPGRPAARVAGRHYCLQTAPKPHKGGRIITGAPTVVVRKRFAARVADLLECEAANTPNQIAFGRFDVIIEGRFAARQWDITTHGGMIQEGEQQVQYGTYAANERYALLIMRIRLSEYGQTEAGRKLVAKLEHLVDTGKIRLDRLPYHLDGTWGFDEGLTINERHADDIETMARVAVHEATHAVIDDEDETKRNKPQSIGDEQRAWDSEVDFYQEQRRHGADERIDLEEYQEARDRGPEEPRKFLEDFYKKRPPA